MVEAVKKIADLAKIPGYVLYVKARGANILLKKRDEEAAVEFLKLKNLFDVPNIALSVMPEMQNVQLALVKESLLIKK